ncbi:MAG: radical SAM family heme chaperone HemW [Lachnospiraceae bacterium]
MKKETEKRPLGLYVHIPFCVKKCNYCDFLSAPAEKEEQERYVEALCKEIRGYAGLAKDYLAETVYFGGGTPSVLDIEQTEKILTTIKEIFFVKGMQKAPEKKGLFGLLGSKRRDTEETVTEETAEMTIEVNPGTVTKEKLAAYRTMGFNRLSIGIQSAQEKELKLLGRIHTFEEAKQCVAWAREAGFTNVSVDVISALPGQTVEEYASTLEQILKLQPEHISSYSLMIEEGTPFYERYGEGGPERDALPEEEVDRAMYMLTKEKLAAAGYERYEISNYAKPGFESRHNSSYWTGTEYLGFGLGASSLFTNARYHNETNLTDYIAEVERGEDVRKDIERLVEAEAMEEFMILGLRRMQGISREEFLRRFGKPLETVYGSAIRKLKDAGLLNVEGDTVALTERGIDVSNQVFVEFVPEEFVRR